MRRLLEALARVEAILSAIGVALLFCIMIIVVLDVFMRYVVGRPFSFTYDLVGVYLMTGVFFLILSHAQAANANVAVDILVAKFSEPMRRVADTVTCIAGGSVFLLIAIVGFDRAWDSYQSNDVLAGVIPWPVWISAALVPIGSGVLVLRLLFTACGHIASLLTGRSLVPLPSHSGDMNGERFE
jgi:TRAP-type C4-dicarboxylate transport system permease small subunit